MQEFIIIGAITGLLGSLVFRTWSSADRLTEIIVMAVVDSLFFAALSAWIAFAVGIK